MVFCNFRIQHIKNLSFLTQSGSLLSLLQAVCNFHIQHINKLSFLTWSEGAFSLSGKQCATSVFNILIIYHSVLEVKEASLSLSSSVQFHIQNINILSFVTGSEGTFSLSPKQCFLVYSLLFYLCISGVLIVMFFTGLCFHAFICLVFLVDGVLSLLFYIQGFPSFFLLKLFEKKCWCGAAMVEQLFNMRDKLLFKSKKLNDPSSQINQSFKATHLNFLLPSTELYWLKCNNPAM